MFDLLDNGRRRIVVWPWILHYLVAVVVPQAMISGQAGTYWLTELADPSQIIRNQALQKQEILAYVLSSAVAILLGYAACLMHPVSAAIAKRTWIFPVCVLSYAVSYDHVVEGSAWNVVTDSYFLTLSDTPAGEEQWLGFTIGSLPALTCIAYALGVRLCEWRGDKL